MGIPDWVVKYWAEVLFGVICSILGFAYKRQSSKFKKRSAQDEAMREGTLALLDDRMGALFDDCKNKGYVTHKQARRYERMYNAYHGLGGNGAVTNEHTQFSKQDIRDE